MTRARRLVRSGAGAYVALAVEGHAIPTGSRIRADGAGLTALVQRVGRSARVEDYLALLGTLTRADRLGRRATHARDELHALADERAALLRVAELSARGTSHDQLFHAVAVEASALTQDHPTVLLRFNGSRAYTVVARCRGRGPVGTRIEIASQDEGLVAEILRTRRPTRRDDDRRRPGPASAGDDCGVVSGVGVPIVVADRLWGVLAATTAGQRLPTTAEHRLQALAAVTAVAVKNAQVQADLRGLAEEQAALRSVAELVARGAPPPDVIAKVATEASRLVHGEPVTLTRFVGRNELVVVAVHGGPAAVGARITFERDTLPDWIRRGAHVARVDDYSGERDADLAETFGLVAAVSAPIVVAGQVWGMLTATSGANPLPPGTEHRLEQFAQLAAAALASILARTELETLADEQAALRRVAELVARGAPLDEVFTSVTGEASHLLGDQPAALCRYEPEGVAVVVAACNSPAPLGLRFPVFAGTGTGEVLRTGWPSRVDDFRSTPLARVAAALGVGVGIAVPVIVEGRVWGCLSSSSPGPPVPSGAEQRLMQFAELAAAAIANAENKAKLTASRARIVATADQARRRLQRDVHDSAQQRLVHTIILLKLARHTISSGGTPTELVEDALRNAERANSELRDVVRGILPVSLTQGGLRTGLESLVAELPLPVDLRITAPRLAAHIETTAYFIVAEGLTNVVKHAHASRATVRVAFADGTLTVEVSDDGTGGVDPARGTGLGGLLDRVDSAEGTLTITGRDGHGTTLSATLPAAPASNGPAESDPATASGPNLG